MKKLIQKIKKQKKKCFRIGILALQGNVKEHEHALKKLGVTPVLVKLPEDLHHIHGLIIPGGESTTIRKLMKQYKLDSKIKKLHKHGMPIYGTCAGAILMATKIEGEKQANLNLADIEMKRNAYGSQLDSFEEELDIDEIGTFHGIFIRAPVISKVHNGATVLATYNKKPVMIKDHHTLITTFHPELTSDTRIHRYFLEMVNEYAHVRDMQVDIENCKH